MFTHTSSRRDFWLVVGASLSWGTVGVANQAIYAHVATNALSLAFFRLLVAALLFVLAACLLPGSRPFRVTSLKSSCKRRFLLEDHSETPLSWLLLHSHLNARRTVDIESATGQRGTSEHVSCLPDSSQTYSLPRLNGKLRDLGVMLLMGVMQALYQASYSAAIAYSGVTVPTLVALCAAPIIVALFSAFVTRERLSMLTLVALICALLGTFLLVKARPHVDGSALSLLGILFALLAGAGYAGFLLCGRLLTDTYHPLHVNAVAFATGALLLLFLAVPGGLTLTYPLWAWLLLLYLGCIPTALAYGLFQVAMRSLSATVVSIVTLCEPLAAALLAWIFFSEQLGPLGLLGAFLLLVAMMLILVFAGSKSGEGRV